MDETLYNLSKLKPNKRTLGIYKMNMWLYLTRDKIKTIKSSEDHINSLNDEIVLKRKDLIDGSQSLSDKKKRKLSRQINRLQSKVEKETTKLEEFKSATEAPVLLDSGQLEVSAKQMQQYLFMDKGYFKAKVFYEVKLHGHKANINYVCIPGQRYYINKYVFSADDRIVDSIIRNDTSAIIMKAKMPYDAETFDKERNRINDLLTNKGYYLFRPQYIRYKVDTLLKGDSVSVALNIINPEDNVKHKIFKIGSVNIEPEFKLGDTLPKPKIPFKDFIFISNEMKVKPNILKEFIYIHWGQLFRDNDKKATLSKLVQLKIYRYVDINFTQDSSALGDTGVLNCSIRMTPYQKYTLSQNIDFNRTEETDRAITNNYSSLYGISATTALINKNLLHSAIQNETRIRGAYEVPFDSLHFFKPVSRLYTYQIGLTNSLIFPQLLTPFRLPESIKNLQGITSLNFDFLREHNGYFNRTTGTANLTYQLNKDNKRFFIIPIELSLVNAQTIGGFQISKDPLIVNLFDQHFISDFRFSYLVNQQPITNVKRKYYVFRTGFEFGGFIPTAIDYAFDNKNKGQNIQTKTLFGIKYYDYAKFDIDLRGYMPVIKDDNITGRLALGYGTPFLNSTILPFEKRYYVGGANSVRAWRTRNVGPGSFHDTTNTFDKSGDIKIEGSLEYRFPIFGFLKSALFTDFGNVWLQKSDLYRPGATLSSNFYKEFAIGAGVGLRFDFSFFIFRFDFAVPLRDPSYAENDRWVASQYKTASDVFNKTLINIGIGYPF